MVWWVLRNSTATTAITTGITASSLSVQVASPIASKAQPTGSGPSYAPTTPIICPVPWIEPRC